MQKITLNDIALKLAKHPISYEKFFTLLESSSEPSFDNRDLSYELLIANGFPIEIRDDYVYLKTAHTNYSDEIFTFIDIETNGSKPLTSTIIEIGALKVMNNEIIDKFDKLIYASDIPEYITKLTGITKQELEDKQNIKDVLSEFKLFLEDSVFVAHDVKFDYNYISTLLERFNIGKLSNRKLCTIDLAKRTIKSPKYGLEFLSSHLDLGTDVFHRAYADAFTSYKIYKESIVHVPLSVKTTEDLIRFSFENIIP